MTAAKLTVRIIGGVAVAGLLTGLVLQHQAQVSLREENQSLQQQVDQLAQLTAENERLSNQVDQSKRSLAADQLNELLRLRNEVGMLRSQTNELERLRGETRRMQASLVKAGQSSAQQPTEAEAAAEEQRAQAITRMTDAKTVVLAMHMHAGDNQGLFPTNFDQLTRYLGTIGKHATDQFEALYNGNLDALLKATGQSPSSIIVLREKQAQRTLDGKWTKTYAFADGHCEVHAEPDGNFDAWEKQRMIALPPGGQ